MYLWSVMCCIMFYINFIHKDYFCIPNMGFYKTILIHPLKETFKTTHYMFFFILPFTLKPMTKLIFPSPNMLLNQPIAFPKPNPFVFVDIQVFTNFLSFRHSSPNSSTLLMDQKVCKHD